MEKDLEKLSLEDKTFNPNFIKYQIKSSSSSIEDVILPEVKDIVFLNSKNNINSLNIDEKKLISFYDNDNKIIDFTKNPHIQNKFLLISISLFLGRINNDFDITVIKEFSEADYYSPLDDTNNFEIFSNYFEYLEKNKQYILFHDIIKSINDFNELILSLEEIGITFPDKSNNILFKSFQSYVFQNNQILVVISSGNNLWIKSDKSVINNVNYDRQLNKMTNLFFNHDFIQKFYEKIIKHPRCKIGIMSSMAYKNIRPTLESIQIIFNLDKNIKFIVFDQKYHLNKKEGEKGKPEYVRSYAKFSEYLKKILNLDNFDLTNMLFLESEEEKVNDLKNNTIFLNTFSEQILNLSDNERQLYNIKTDKAIDYIEKLLNELNGDIREYLKDHTLN